MKEFTHVVTILILLMIILTSCFIGVMEDNIRIKIVVAFVALISLFVLIDHVEGD